MRQVRKEFGAARYALREREADEAGRVRQRCVRPAWRYANTVAVLMFFRTASTLR